MVKSSPELYDNEKDEIDSYFECITQCNLNKKGFECITRCIEVHLKHED